MAALAGSCGNQEEISASGSRETSSMKEGKEKPAKNCGLKATGWLVLFKL